MSPNHQLVIVSNDTNVFIKRVQINFAIGLSFEHYKIFLIYWITSNKLYLKPTKSKPVQLSSRPTYQPSNIFKFGHSDLNSKTSSKFLGDIPIHKI